MNAFLAIAALTGLVTVYALWARPWLKAQPWAAGFFARVEPVEIMLFKNSKTILFARLKIVVGIALTVLTQVGALDLTPMLPLLPEQHRGLALVAFNLLPLIISLVGMADERLRNVTTEPIALVSVNKDTLPPQARIAIADAEMTKEQAVEIVKKVK